MTREIIYDEFYEVFDDEELLEHIRDTANAIDLPWQLIRVKERGYTGGVGGDVLRDEEGKVKIYDDKRDALKSLMSKVHDKLGELN